MGINQSCLIKKQYDNDRRNAHLKLIELYKVDNKKDLETNQFYSTEKNGYLTYVRNTTFLKANIQRTKERLKYSRFINL